MRYNRGMKTLIPLIMMATLGFGCEEKAAVVEAATGGGQIYVYTIKISATTSDYEIAVTTPSEALNTGTVTISGTSDEYTISGTSITGTVTRHSGPGSMDVVVKKDGVPVYTGNGILTSTGTRDISGL